MRTYFAYHHDYDEPFTVDMGYGLDKKTKIDKIDINNEVYIIQKAKGSKVYELCGKYRVIGHETSTTHTAGGKYRLKLSTITSMDKPLTINESEWSERLPESTAQYEGWSNFQKHFCQTGASLRTPLDEDIIAVFEHFLSEFSPSVESHVIDDIDHLLHDDSLSATERTVLAQARIGQGQFKSNVKKTWKTKRCAVLLYDLEDILVASHIRAWTDCKSKSEKLDGANGLLLSANVDKVFDRHIITFKPDRDKFKLTYSKRVERKKLDSLGLEEGIDLDLTHLSFDDLERFKKYMARHNEIFDLKNL
ncbi:HNH endonuclease [Vibrio alginolyticus]